MKRIESYKKLVHKFRYYCNMCKEPLDKDKHKFQFQREFIHLCNVCFEELENLLFKGKSVTPSLKE